MNISKKQIESIKRRINQQERDKYTCQHWKKQYQISRLIKTSSGESKLEKKARLAIESASKEPVEEITKIDKKTNKPILDKYGNEIKRPIYKFRFSHIEAANIDWDILFVYGKKGIGKTVECGRYCDRLFKEDPNAQIFFLRNTKEEMDALDVQFSASSSWPFIKIGNKLYHKTLTSGRGRSTRPRHVGYCTYLSGGGLNKWKGGEYERIRAIIWDECNNEVDNFRLEKDTLFRLLNFTNSIIRSKKNIKIIMFGNLLRNDNGTVNNSLLRSMWIDQSSKLKIIDLKSHDNESLGKMIYWNSGDAYTGIEGCKYVNMFRGLNTDELMTNMPTVNVDNIVSDAEFVCAKPLWAYVFSYKQEVYCLYLGYLTIEERVVHVCKVEKYDPELTYYYRLTSDEVMLKNNQKYKIEKIESEEVKDKLEDVYDISECGNLWYGSEESILLLRELMYKWTKQYKLSYSDRDSF